MKENKYYTQIEVDEYVRKLMTSSEISLSRMSEQLENMKRENRALEKELDELKKKDKSASRTLKIAERKARYIESTTRSKCAMEVERLARLAEKWDAFFSSLSEKYQAVDKAKLAEFKNELNIAIDQMLEMQNSFESPLTDAEKAHLEEINRLKAVKEKKTTDISSRFDKLVLEFNMKIGESATRGRGRPKKEESAKIAKQKQAKAKSKVYPPRSESGFDFEDALNPTDSLENIMNDLMGE